MPRTWPRWPPRSRPTIPATRTSRPSSSSTSSGSRSRPTVSGRTASGTKRTGSTTTSCGSPTARAPGSRCARSWASSRCARPPSSTRRRGTRCPRRRGASGSAWSACRRSRPACIRPAPGTWACTSGASAPIVNPDRLRRILTRVLDPESSWLRTGSAPSRATTSTIRSCSRSESRSSGWATCPRSRTTRCSAATPTGAVRSGSRSTSSSSAPSRSSTCITATASRSSVPPDRVT